MSTIPADLVPRTGDSLETLFSKVLGRLNEMEVSGGGTVTIPPASTTVAGVTRYVTVVEAPSATLFTAALTPGAVAQGGLAFNNGVLLNFGLVGAISTDGIDLIYASTGDYKFTGGVLVFSDGSTIGYSAGASSLMLTGSSALTLNSPSTAFGGSTVSFNSSMGGTPDARFSNGWSGPNGTVYAYGGVSTQSDALTLMDSLAINYINIDPSGGYEGLPFIGLGGSPSTSADANQVGLSTFLSYFGVVGGLIPTSANMNLSSMAFGMSPTTSQPCLFFCDGTGVFYQIALGTPVAL